ncbi:MAG TPA: hypothetical protein VMY69_09775, partial [Phycisphaerae bacterium]|nr:hypothetical protein [Phycisphaerae bacterium]
NIIFFVGIYFLVPALVSRWAGRLPASGQRHGWKHEIGALAILILVVNVAIETVHELGLWFTTSRGPFLTPTILSATTKLAAPLAACFIIGLVFWRNADAPSRWRGIAMASLWIALNAWFPLFRFISAEIESCPTLSQVVWPVVVDSPLGGGIVAGVLALLYVHLVITPYWNLAYEPGPPNH